MKAQATYRHNGQAFNISTTNKAANIEAFAINANRWFQKSHGNTYCVAYISALINGKWEEIGKTKMQYGYGDHYLVTAGDWLVENGYLVGEGVNGYALAKRSVREALKIEHYVEDVKRQKDL